MNEISQNSNSPTGNDDVSNLSISLGYNVRKLRKTLKLSKTRLSTMTGICRPLLNEIEQGTSNIRLSYVHALADALKVSPVELFLPPPEGHDLRWH